MIDPSRLENVLPACLYSPTYVVKDFPIARYQGLQFVSLRQIPFGTLKYVTHINVRLSCVRCALAKMAPTEAKKRPV